MKSILLWIAAQLGIPHLFGHYTFTLAQFRERVVRALHKHKPGLAIEQPDEEHLTIKSPDGASNTCFLGNSYRVYQQNGREYDDLIKKLLQHATLDTSTLELQMQRESILAILKPMDFIDAIQRQVQEAVPAPQPIFMPFSSNLAVCFVQDLPNGMRYLDSNDMETLGLSIDGVFHLALENFRKRFKIEWLGGNGMWLPKVDGNYESAVLLSPSSINYLRAQVQGRLLALPLNRDLILFGGENNKNIPTIIEELLQKTASLPYPLSRTWLVYEGGKFVDYSPVMAQ
ncbi:MAG TPA: hypothetical protein PK299_01585 [Anaerolineales bacterium]|nr:hypothetical protein [Anaerolineales bacterium]